MTLALSRVGSHDSSMSPEQAEIQAVITDFVKELTNRMVEICDRAAARRLQALVESLSAPQKRRGRPPKALGAEVLTEAPKRRGRPPKAPPAFQHSEPPPVSVPVVSAAPRRRST